MRWLKRSRWKACLAIAGLLFFLVFMIWVPMSAHAIEGASILARSAPVDTTPTPDLTVTALAKKQLGLQVDQLQNQLNNQNNWFENNSTALIAATATVIVALFGIYQWAMNRRDQRQKELVAQDKELKDREEERRKELAAQDKDLRDRAEERFRSAVTALGDENESVQINGAVLLRSFLNEEDKEIYGRYYTQIFDLAVAYLRLSNASRLSQEPEEIPYSQITPDNILPLTTLRQALTVVFREALPLAREQHKDPQSLDASGIQLDRAYLMHADLRRAWLMHASLRRVNLFEADLYNAELTLADLQMADLREANLSKAYLPWANLSKAVLNEASLEGAFLSGAVLVGADLSGASLDNADLDGANLSMAKLNGVNLANVESMKNTNLCGVEGLAKKQLRDCKAKGAIIDEDSAADSSQPDSIPAPTS